MENNQLSKRVKVKLKSPNPLFEKWLLEWHKEEIGAAGINTETVYSRALESLRKFPLVLKSGFECIILEHFDKELCLKLTTKLTEYEAFKHKETNGLSDTAPEKSVNREIKKCTRSPIKRQKDENLVIAPERSLKNSANEDKVKQKKKKRTYVPMKRSAAYGILLALALKENEPNYLGFLTKTDIITAAQKHSDVSMKKVLPGSFYSGWSSMSQLVSKGLVEKFSNPAKFKLTEEGRELALKLKNDSVDFVNDETHEPVLSLEAASKLIAPHKQWGRKNKITEENDFSEECMFQSDQLTKPVSQSNGTSQFDHISEGIFSQKSSGISSQSQEFFVAEYSPKIDEIVKGPSPQSQDFETQEMIFLPNNFEIILLVDSNETEGKQRRDEDEVLMFLESLSVKYEVRGLKVGDYLWIARDSFGREMVLPYIIERKRLDDLAHSIKDGRFHEQKFRLKLCGLQNKIYLVENYNYPKESPFMESIHQAITNTLVCDKFIVRFTRDLSETARYLATQTKILLSTFQNKTLFSCKKKSVPETIDPKDDIVSLISFAEFSLEMDKTKELTAREDFALQLVQLKGMSSDKAWAITEVYPTPQRLIEGFLSGEAESIISELRCGLMRNKVGPQLSSVLKTFYTSREFTG